jgi:hypothetical protein
LDLCASRLTIFAQSGRWQTRYRRCWCKGCTAHTLVYHQVESSVEVLQVVM